MTYLVYKGDKRNINISMIGDQTLIKTINKFILNNHTKLILVEEFKNYTDYLYKDDLHNLYRLFVYPTEIYKDYTDIISNKNNIMNLLIYIIIDFKNKKYSKELYNIYLNYIKTNIRYLCLNEPKYYAFNFIKKINDSHLIELKELNIFKYCYILYKIKYSLNTIFKYNNKLYSVINIFYHNPSLLNYYNVNFYELLNNSIFKLKDRYIPNIYEFSVYCELSEIQLHPKFIYNGIYDRKYSIIKDNEKDSFMKFLNKLIFNRQHKQQCSLCCNLKYLILSCGKCENLICNECNKSLYKSLCKGNIFNPNILLCPFCKRRPDSLYLNKKINKIIKYNDNIDYNSNIIYAWCNKCSHIKEYCPKECAVEEITLKDKFICTSCQIELNEDYIKNNTKICPSCGISVFKEDGCNHITCGKCKNHWCWKCLKICNSSSIYDHMRNVHGGIYN